MRVPGLGGANKEEVRGVLGVLVGYWCNTGCGGDAVGYSMRVWGEYGCAEGGRAPAGPHGGTPWLGSPLTGDTSSGTLTLPSTCVQFIEELEMKRGMDLFKLSI